MDRLLASRDPMISMWANRRILRSLVTSRAHPLARARVFVTLAALIGVSALVLSARFALSVREARGLLPSPPVIESDKAQPVATRPALPQDGFFERKLLGREAVPPNMADGASGETFQAGAITLVAIVGGGGGDGVSSRSGGEKKAALYSESSDQFLLVAAGETFGDAFIEAIDGTSVEMRQGGERKRLSLRDGPRTITRRP